MTFDIFRSAPVRALALGSLVALCAASSAPTARAQDFGNFDRERGRTMLKVVKNEIKKKYYDPAYHGMDVEARFKTAEEKITASTSMSQMLAIIAQAVLDLDDSHTFFLPPQRGATVQYGWTMAMVGDACYVAAVKPGSDAAAKGLKPGDQILAIDQFKPSRATLWKINYLYNGLRPVAETRLQVKSPDAATAREVVVASKISAGKRMLDLNNNLDVNDLIRSYENYEVLREHRYVESGPELMIWQMPQFDLPDKNVDAMIEKARGHKALVIDLRGNGGGYVSTLERLVGNLFDHDVTIGTRKEREKSEQWVAKTRGKNAFTGKLVVLIDSESGSASELLARVVQLEKRGTVVGDRSAGAVMESIHQRYELGGTSVVAYGVSVTMSDILMTDGKSIEHVGVMPDETKVATPAEMAKIHDPVLAYAAGLAGVEVTPERAGAMFPVRWEK